MTDHRPSSATSTPPKVAYVSRKEPDSPMTSPSSSNPVRLDVDHLVVKTNCSMCFVSINHSQRSSDFHYVCIGLLSTHAGWWSGQLRTRIAEAWRILRGGSYPFIELVDAEETDALISALQIARQEAFGSAEDDNEVRPEQAQGQKEESGREQRDTANVADSERANGEENDSNEQKDEFRQATTGP